MNKQQGLKKKKGNVCVVIESPKLPAFLFCLFQSALHHSGAVKVESSRLTSSSLR